ncbi:DnaJ-domain-containing protein [Rhizopus microsporus var. microsporus]|uniref:DnaJ-domain-containing protein n=1 Tax=Rhizopus microsporus var. microsporus TaxID=86635 RepID=A0A1X0QUH6_RHIZD|nr:DnaJ-domain-containing protein [Rhizopus microsporus var. microsporus]
MNVYAVLNVGEDATLEEIKKSYRRLALRYHPDKNPQCEEQFRNVNQAYNILSDPKKRRIYDRYGMAGVNMIDTMGPGAILLDPEVEAVILTFFCILSLLSQLAMECCVYTFVDY